MGKEGKWEGKVGKEKGWVEGCGQGRVERGFEERLEWTEVRGVSVNEGVEGRIEENRKGIKDGQEEEEAVEMRGWWDEEFKKRKRSGRMRKASSE